MKKKFEEIIGSPERIKEHYSSKENNDFLEKQRKNGSHYGTLKGKKPQYNREELIQYLIKNDIKTEVDLKKKRKDLDPYIKDYKKEFGSWKEAKKTAWGFLDRSVINPHENNPQFFIDLAIQYNITKKVQYQRKHKEFPKDFPPVNQILKIWMKWENFYDSVEKMSDKIQINKYMNLGRTLKRIPSAKEAEKEGIYLDKVIKTWAEGNGITIRYLKKYSRKKMFDNYLFKDVMKKEYQEWKKLKTYYYDKPISAKD